MRRRISVVLAAGAVAIAVATGCGETPKPYRHIPRLDTKKVAIGAAAAATALTLANPKGASRKAEQQGESDEEKRPKKSGGEVPPDVLDRLDQAEKHEDEDCAKPDEDESERPPRVELFPTDTAGGLAPPKPKKCRDDKDESDEDDDKSDD